MDKDTSGTKFLTFRDICIVCVTGVALGVLMISGKIFIIGTAILEFVKKIFMKGGFFR
jgi:predicted transporter